MESLLSGALHWEMGRAFIASLLSRSRLGDEQWLDVTDIAPGYFSLRVTINPEDILTESDYTNHTASVTVKIPTKIR